MRRTIVGGHRDCLPVYSHDFRTRAMGLLESGLSLNAVSKRTGASRSALREWRDHGIAPRGRPVACFVCAPDLDVDRSAYARLLGYYLGDGCISRTRRALSLRVSCDATYPGIIADVSDAILGVHLLGQVSHVSAPGTVVVQCWWNHWPCLFPQHGPGRKHERQLTLEPWQREIVREHPAALLRGLLHSDGCRVKNWVTRSVGGVTKRYEYPRWQFVNHSADIRTWCTEALDLLEIPWRESNWKTISVSTRAGVARLDELVGLKR